MADFPWLTFVILLPAAAAVLVTFLPARSEVSIRSTALVGTILAFLVSLGLLASFEVGEPGLQLVEHYSWIPQWGVSYKVGVDGITLPLVLLSTFITPLAILATWSEIKEQLKAFYVAVLLTEAIIIGVFVALDLILFNVFFDALLVPMYLLIGIWGSGNRRYAAVKFFLYSLIGGLLMLVAILYLYFQGGAVTFDYEVLRELSLTQTEEIWLFLAFFIAFGIKLPIWPLHTWLPDAHTEAPTIGSVDLASILLKIGGYGIIRFLFGIFPNATRILALPIVALGVVSILYGALVATMQRDIKRLVAYSSVSHMGFVILGLFALNPMSASASVVQMVNHGLSTGALFILVGFLYQRTHSRLIAEHSGLLRATPVFGGLFLVVALSSLALPGLNGFVGEFPILLGSFQTVGWFSVAGTFGMVFAALYLLWAYQRMFHGPVEGKAVGMTDLNLREIAAMAPIVALIVGIGVYPQPLYSRIQPTMDAVVEQQRIRGGEPPRVGPVAKSEQVVAAEK
ncbi:MAG: NADH-quinone oxidoreductase subunit M [Actinomycetota bacterium]|nr:NADH-quinone oxidoreductase subunit M [Actinomycetota bacterium]